MFSVQRKFKHSVNVTIFRNCGKVMFSKACVKNSVQEGKVYTPQADTPLGRPPLYPQADGYCSGRYTSC